jgi:hypothetical protein
MTVKLKTTASEGVETPSQMIVKRSQKEFSVVDSMGRTIVVKVPSWLKRANFTKALGKNALNEDGTINQLYYGSIMQVMFAKSVDGIPVTLNNEMEIDKWLNILDDEGRLAIEKCCAENFDQAIDEERLKQEIKK